MTQSCTHTDSPSHLEFPSDLVPGYETTISGEDLLYHSPIPYVERSLLVRSLARARHIEWQTAAVPDDFVGDTAEFALMAAIDVNDDIRSFEFLVNDDFVLSFENPSTTDVEQLSWSGDRGVSAEFRITEIDKYDDAMGFLFVRVPRDYWNDSRSVRLKIVGESAGTRTWFMVFKEAIKPGITLRNTPALLRGDNEHQQLVRADLLHLGDSGHLRLNTAHTEIDTAITLGHRQFLLPVPTVERPTAVDIAIDLDGLRSELPFTVEPVQPLDLHLIHHTHLDIGYTHLQKDVEHLQWQHLETALELGEAGDTFPDEARFVWNPEGLWAVESYLENHGENERERLLEGIRRGWIALDGLFANLLTGMATSEGLLHGMDASRKIGTLTGIPIQSAMLTDIPGFTWGLVPVLASSGVKYLSIGPNFGHRIGFFSDALGDKPFYWESPSGNERVLTWVSGAGYSWFHTGLGYANISNRLDETNIFKYLDLLVEGDYPYDISHMRYNIGSDNGPPDPSLTEKVQAWNERYASPRLIISSTTELFENFESKYGDQLPVYRGDLTGHWEDGVASSARETAMVRRVAESLVQTEVLSTMLGHPLAKEELYEAWRNVLLYYEHTWGSWNSVSEPEAEFTIGQWEQKKAFAETARFMADDLRQQVLADRHTADSSLFEVLNTLSWNRSDIVVLTADQSREGDRVLGESGEPVPSQRLSSGELAFLTGEVPAFGSRRFRVVPGNAVAPADATSGHTMSSSTNRLTVDPERGTITALEFLPMQWDFANAGTGYGLNEYLYVSSRNPTDAHTSDPAQVSVRDAGPLVWTLETKALAPGMQGGISSEIRIYEGSDRIDIINRLDKTLVYDPEAVFYRFPFNIPNPEIRIDVPWGSFTPETDQIPGASKNYMSVQRWVDIHNRELGITIATIDVPMVQFGEVSTDAIVSGWVEHFEPSATLLSYVMNNYWETNYRAGQEGYHEFRYALRPHAAFTEAECERFATGVAHPMVVSPVRQESPSSGFPLRFAAASTVVTFLAHAGDGDGYVVRLFNPSESEDTITLNSLDGSDVVVYSSDMWQRKLGRISNPISIGAYGIVTLRIDR